MIALLFFGARWLLHPMDNQVPYGRSSCLVEDKRAGRKTKVAYRDAMGSYVLLSDANHHHWLIGQLPRLPAPQMFSVVANLAT